MKFPFLVFGVVIFVCSCTQKNNSDTLKQSFQNSNSFLTGRNEQYLRYLTNFEDRFGEKNYQNIIDSFQFIDVVVKNNITHILAEEKGFTQPYLNKIKLEILALSPCVVYAKEIEENYIKPFDTLNTSGLPDEQANQLLILEWNIILSGMRNMFFCSSEGVSDVIPVGHNNYLALIFKESHLFENIVDSIHIKNVMAGGQFLHPEEYTIVTTKDNSGILFNNDCVALCKSDFITIQFEIIGFDAIKNPKKYFKQFKFK